MKTRNRIRVQKGIFILFLPFIIFFVNPSILTAQQHGDLVRIQGETKIYLIQNGQRRIIANEDVFRQMGFKMEEVKELDSQTVMNLPEGPPLWSKEVLSPYPDGTLIRLTGKGQAYVIRGGRKCYIPDPETFQAQGFQWDQVIEVDQSVFNKIPTGIPLASVKPPIQYRAPGMPPMAPPGSPTSPYPPATYPPSPYPPSAYPPAPTPSPQPYPYPPSGPQPPPYPPSTAPPSPPPSPSPSPPSPPSKPSSRLPREDLFLFKKSFMSASAVDFTKHKEKTETYLLSQVLGIIG